MIDIKTITIEGIKDNGAYTQILIKIKALKKKLIKKIIQIKKLILVQKKIKILIKI